MALLEPSQERRLERFRRIQDIIRSNEPVEYKKLVALLGVNLGISDRKAREYLATLKIAQFIEIKQGQVKLKRSGDVARAEKTKSRKRK